MEDMTAIFNKECKAKVKCDIFRFGFEMSRFYAFGN